MTTPELLRHAANADALMVQVDHWQEIWILKNRALSVIDGDIFGNYFDKSDERMKIATEAEHAGRQLERLGAKPMAAFSPQADTFLLGRAA